MESYYFRAAVMPLFRSVASFGKLEVDTCHELLLPRKAGFGFNSVVSNHWSTAYVFQLFAQKYLEIISQGGASFAPSLYHFPHPAFGDENRAWIFQQPFRIPHLD